MLIELSSNESVKLGRDHGLYAYQQTQSSSREILKECFKDSLMFYVKSFQSQLQLLCCWNRKAPSKNHVKPCTTAAGHTFSYQLRVLQCN